MMQDSQMTRRIAHRGRSLGASAAHVTRWRKGSRPPQTKVGLCELYYCSSISIALSQKSTSFSGADLQSRKSDCANDCRKMALESSELRWRDIPHIVTSNHVFLEQVACSFAKGRVNLAVDAM